MSSRTSHLTLRLSCAQLARLVLVASSVLPSSAAVFGAATAAGSQSPVGVSAGTRSAAEYRVGRGDELNFRFFYVPELNTVATVRSDGHLVLPLAGDLQVEGLSVGELSALVQERLADQVRRPQVVINVQAGGSQRVFVGGEVMRPGVQPLVGTLSVVQAVMVAEGLKDTAQARKVVVLRRGGVGEREVLQVDLDAALRGEDVSQDLALQAYDVVVVPRSGIADLNLWVDQYIKRVLPFSMGLSYSINRDGAVR